MEIEELQNSLKRYRGMNIAASVLMIVLGILAILLPFAAGIAISICVSWLIILIGIAHLVYAFAARGVSGFIWRLLLGIFYIAGGLYLAFHPGLNLLSLTLVLAVILFAEGILQVLSYFKLRPLPGSGWILLDGVVTLLLGLLIGFSWPSGAVWAIGTIVGVNFLLSGITRLGYSATVRKAQA
jgi:uncharacterized membrane protein HdeD (DUF308 family)